MTNDEDQKFDQFIKSNMKEASARPNNEWQMIHKEIYEGGKAKKSSWFLSMWPVMTVFACALVLIVHNYNSYHTNDIDNLFKISFSTDQSWSSSTTLIDLPAEDNS